MARKNSSFLPIIVIVIIVLAAGFFVFSGAQNSSPDKSKSPAQQQSDQAGAEIYSASDPRFQKCSELGSRFTGQEKANFIDACMNYLYKFCFDTSQCGPYQCVGNKCQVE